MSDGRESVEMIGAVAAFTTGALGEEVQGDGVSFLWETRRRLVPMGKPSRALIALVADSGLSKLTKPNPRLNCVRASTMILHEIISPKFENMDQSSRVLMSFGMWKTKRLH